MSWHVTPEPDSSRSSWGTKVEVLGQFHGSLEEFEAVKGRFLQRLADKGETNVQVGQRTLSARFCVDLQGAH